MLEEPFFASPAAFNSSRRTVFQPNFDVREEKDSYILEGEVPGINDKSKLDVHFADPQTLVIKGRVEQSRSAGTQPQALEGTTTAQTQTVEAESSKAAEKPPKPTVEDEGAEGSTEVVKAAGESAEVANVDSNKTNQNGSRLWVSERMVGEFQRSFSFPNSVDQDAVKASLKDGILSIVVPKKEGNFRKKINVD
jgi:HSP20 family molecular chaperone IbpA